ncbi:hypothetical protein RUND412_003845 [Rhizina undulata]
MRNFLISPASPLLSKAAGSLCRQTSNLSARRSISPTFFHQSAIKPPSPKFHFPRIGAGLARYFHASPRAGGRRVSKAIAEQSSSVPATEHPRLLDRLKAAGQISNYEVPPVMSPFQRLWRPFLFTLAICGGSYAFAANWRLPNREDRLFPDVPVSFATVASIIGVNVAIFLAWKVPLPASWRLLNKYFISVPALPYSVSLIGNVFSHQTFTHLAMNMFVLYVFGTSLCEQIGRGNFLALYFSAGTVSSFVSLAANVFRSRFHIFALGASGAISGIIGTFTYFNPNHELYFVLLPFLAFKASHFVTGLALLETVGIVRGWAVLDHVAHLSGLGWGLGYGYYLEQQVKKRKELLQKQYRR